MADKSKASRNDTQQVRLGINKRLSVRLGPTIRLRKYKETKVERKCEKVLTYMGEESF